ncbi:hypothetical protein Taro_033716 [Colocasia esculenta]|uniref:Uncharacterized protein n=1 Tax=Colocasia esculenta TaxID=4460 RepID=A0A843WD96_COLES|nr:hypothetical protein [Colocasia esculenta]
MFDLDLTYLCGLLAKKLRFGLDLTYLCGLLAKKLRKRFDVNFAYLCGLLAKKEIWFSGSAYLCGLLAKRRVSFGSKPTFVVCWLEMGLDFFEAQPTFVNLTVRWFLAPPSWFDLKTDSSFGFWNLPFYLGPEIDSSSGFWSWPWLGPTAEASFGF